MRQLTELNVSFCSITEKGMQHFVAAKKIEVLKMHGCNGLDAAALSYLPQCQFVQNKSLRTLDLGHCKNIEDAALHQLAQCVDV